MPKSGCAMRGKLLRHRAAIEAGVDPAALVEAINAAQADRAAARAALDSLADDPVLDLRQIDAMVDSLGDIAATIGQGEPSDQVNLYRAFGIRMRYEPRENLVLVQSEPRVVSARVRGGRIPHSRSAVSRTAVSTGIPLVRERGRVQQGDAGWLPRRCPRRLHA